MARSARIFMIVLPLVAAGALGLAVQSIARSNAAPADAPPAGAAMPGQETVVAGSGLVEPFGREVAVATPVQGVVSRVGVKPGDLVTAGQELFAIDDRLARNTLDQRRADLAAAQARLAQTGALLPQRQADVAAARAALASAEADRDEAKDQADAGAQLSGSAITEREQARRLNALRSAEARVAESQARLDGAIAAAALVDPAQQGATLMIDRATVDQAQAAVAQAETQLDQFIVRAPQDGTVLTVDVRPGEYALQGGGAPVGIGVLAPLQVRVDVDEADLPRLRMGAPATASRRGAPAEQIPLTFLRAEPLLSGKKNLAGGDERVDTRVLQLIYQVDGAAADLRPGQLLDVVIRDAAPAQAGSS